MATRCEELSEGRVAGFLIWNEALVASFCIWAVDTSTASGAGSAMTASAGGAPPPSEGRAVDKVSLTFFQSSPVFWLMTPK
ncbi:hypothetical protein G6F50_017723 [Rhizopus delemar]|uniref:Uncharacterized protein n=1 Tax=Rhizopus delemar TaxID=936053 RepID=A0A9P6XP87_9FUNG|nr:hypothetical protein G6F50_017723 [Rhizopus delemar]